MASFVIHNIAGERLLKLLEENYGFKFTLEQRDEFLLGNLIVDSSRLKFQKVEGKTTEESKKIFRNMVQQEKIATHFRDENDIDLCIQAPNLDKFENKYNSLLRNSLSTLGYLFHLYTDRMFFCQLFTSTFDTLDKDMKVTIYTRDTKMMRVIKNNSIYRVEEFWNGESKTSIYHDYTIMNKILLDYYGCSFDKDRLLKRVDSFTNPGIEEVDFNNIISVINKTATFISQSYEEKDSNLNIFDENMIKNFIDYVAIGFIQKYSELLELYNVNQNTRKRVLN